MITTDKYRCDKRQKKDVPKASTLVTEVDYVENLKEVNSEKKSVVGIQRRIISSPYM